jgi:hypothetical protein
MNTDLIYYAIGTLAVACIVIADILSADRALFFRMQKGGDA